MDDDSLHDEADDGEQMDVGLIYSVSDTLEEYIDLIHLPAAAAAHH